MRDDMSWNKGFDVKPIEAKEYQNKKMKWDPYRLKIHSKAAGILLMVHTTDFNDDDDNDDVEVIRGEIIILFL